MEHTQQLKLKERQKFFEEAFQQDMEQYLSAGYLQIAERRGKSGEGRRRRASPCVCERGSCCGSQGGVGNKVLTSPILLLDPKNQSGRVRPLCLAVLFCLFL